MKPSIIVLMLFGIYNTAAPFAVDCDWEIGNGRYDYEVEIGSARTRDECVHMVRVQCPGAIANSKSYLLSITSTKYG